MLRCDVCDKTIKTNFTIVPDCNTTFCNDCFDSFQLAKQQTLCYKFDEINGHARLLKEKIFKVLKIEKIVKLLRSLI